LRPPSDRCSSSSYRLCALAKELLQLLELCARLRVLDVPMARKLACESKQRLSVEIDVGVLGGSGRARRPGVESFFPAVYDGSFRQQALTM
jgi:hypothetical protein